jgi:hypothetical protein
MGLHRAIMHLDLRAHGGQTLSCAIPGFSNSCNSSPRESAIFCLQTHKVVECCDAAAGQTRTLRWATNLLFIEQGIHVGLGLRQYVSTQFDYVIIESLETSLNIVFYNYVNLI